MTNYPESLLANMYADVVNGKKLIEAITTYSSNPDEIGKIFSTFPAEYSVYLVNESDTDLTNITIYTGGFASLDEDGVLELNRTTKEYGPLSRGEALFIETLDYRILDFVLWYDLTLQIQGPVEIKAKFSIFKAYALKKEILRYSDILREDAYRFPLTIG